MLIRSFTSYSPSAVIKVPLFALFLWLFSLLYTHLGQHPDNAYLPLYSPMGELVARYYFFSVFLSLLLNSLAAFWLNYIVNQHNLLSKKTYLPALFYLIYSAFCGQLLVLLPGTLANLLLIGASYELFSTYRKDSALSEVFNSGVLIGLASLLYFPSLFMFFFILATLLIFRPFIWREYVVSLLGLALPWSYFIVYFFWTNRLAALKTGLWERIAAHKQFHFPVSMPYTWLYLVFGTVVVASLFRLASSQLVMPLKSKKTFSLLFWFFILALLSVYANPHIGPSALLLLAIPLSIFTSNLVLQVKKPWVAELTFSALLLAILLVHLQAFLHK